VINPFLQKTMPQLHGMGAPQEMPAAAQVIRDWWNDGNMTVNEGFGQWDIPNESCNPFPYPLDMRLRETYQDQTLYYPSNANTEYSALDPLSYPDTKTLHQILRLR
jgi:hypothetical protein